LVGGAFTNEGVNFTNEGVNFRQVAALFETLATSSSLPDTVKGAGSMPLGLPLT